MKENAKIEQQLDDEQLQDVTGGGLFGIFGRDSRATTLNQIDHSQQQATMLSKRADQLKGKNATMSTIMQDRTAEHLNEINRLNDNVKGW
jgi:hypothetical protein